MQEVADGFGAVVDGGAADFGEVEAGVEGVGNGIGRIEIDFADDAGVAGGFGALEQIGVEGAGVAFAASGWCNDDAVDIDEFFVWVIFEMRAEPQKIYALVARGLVEGDEQRVGAGDGGGVKGFADELIELGEREQRELGGVVVIEREKR